ncbi:F-box protein-like protein [Tanacetum coccineum]
MSKKRSRISKEDDSGIMSKRSRISKEDDLGITSKKRSRISNEDDLGIMSKKRSRISNEVVFPVELIHLIQSLLSLKEGGRTCVLSKSWLGAWYTLPTLKFMHTRLSTHEIETKFNNLVHTTLQRYHIDNTPIQSFHLLLCIFFKNTLENLPNWIRLVVSNRCLKDLSLDIRFSLDDDNSFTILPNELFSSQRLHTIHVTSTPLTAEDLTNLRLRICSTNVINCVSLRVLDLNFVFINQDVLNNLLSTCSLLEKVKLHWCRGLINVKVKNLLRLTELFIHSIEENNLWEINNVPSLCSFRYHHVYPSGKPILFQMDSLASVTQLCIEGDLSFDNSFFDKLESKFPLLESLTLSIDCCELKNLVFTSASLKWLTLTLIPIGLTHNVQVYAPKLLSFIYSGKLPGLLFLTTPPKQVKLCLGSWEYLDHSYFLKMREALNSSSKFDIYIESCILDSLVHLNDIDVDDLRRRVLFPVRNVELELETRLDEHAWEQSRFFDAFFLICHPSYIRCRYHVIRKTMEEDTTNQLKEVLLKNPHNGNWEALTTSEKSDLHTFTGHLECKLIWFA